MGVTRKWRGREILAGNYFELVMKIDGTLVEGNSKALYTARLTGFTVHAIEARLGTLHTTSTGGVGEIVQVRNLTDTLDLMDTPNRIAFTDTWALTDLTGVATSLLQNRVVGINDVLALDVDDVDTGTGAADLEVRLYCERTPNV